MYCTYEDRRVEERKLGVISAESEIGIRLHRLKTCVKFHFLEDLEPVRVLDSRAYKFSPIVYPYMLSINGTGGHARLVILV